MWDLIVSVPDHCLSFYFEILDLASIDIVLSRQQTTKALVRLHARICRLICAIVVRI